jgi:hypothetical protein
MSKKNTNRKPPEVSKSPVETSQAKGRVYDNLAESMDRTDENFLDGLVEQMKRIKRNLKKGK